MEEEFQLAPQDIAIEIMRMAIENLAKWPLKTAEAFRNACLGENNSTFAINPLLQITNDGDIRFLRGIVRNTVIEGRMIDFGFIPNDVIQEESGRARHAFEEREFQQPFKSWLGLAAWEGGANGYLISEHPHYADDILVLELYGISIPDICDMIMVYDIISIGMKGPGQTLIYPAPMTHPWMNQRAEAVRRGSNSLDPLVTMLRFLADASIPMEVIPAPDKLNKQRIKKGKPPIPEHTVVKTRDYVSLFKTAGARSPSKGGTHASPIAHWRRAHMRTLKSGKVVPVRQMKINWRDIEELHRMYYRTKKKPT